MFAALTPNALILTVSTLERCAVTDRRLPPSTVSATQLGKVKEVLGRTGRRLWPTPSLPQRSK
jgi:hypothetical protein